MGATENNRDNGKSSPESEMDKRSFLYKAGVAEIEFVTFKWVC